MKNSSNLNISCKVVFSLNKWNKKVGSPSSFGRKRPFISLNSSASIENLSSSERARARARANHAKNDAQKGCAMQLNGITLKVNAFTNISTAVPRVDTLTPLWLIFPWKSLRNQPKPSPQSQLFFRWTTDLSQLSTPPYSKVN